MLEAVLDNKKTIDCEKIARKQKLLEQKG